MAVFHDVRSLVARQQWVIKGWKNISTAKLHTNIFVDFKNIPDMPTMVLFVLYEC